MYIIETFNLTKEFSGLKAVNSINFKIKKGEIFGLLGPNGAGKTTLISMLCTILKPSNGTAKVNGFEIVKEQGEVRKSIGVVFQDPSLDNRLTGMENLKIHLGLYGVKKEVREKRLNEVLELVGLKDRINEFVKNYSGGMKRRLEIARGLLHYPQVLFLDEPTLGLDHQTREHIWDYIRTLAKKEKITIIVTTHYMEEADELCDRVAIIDYGEIKVLDKPENLKRKLKGDTIILEIDKNNNLENKLNKLKFNVKLINGKFYINVPESTKALPQILDFMRKNKLKTKSISIRKPTLGDVFLHYTGREIRDETNEKNSNKKMFMARHV